MSEMRICEACGGTGVIEVGVGLGALEAKYPTLPIREMAARGWLASVDDWDNTEACDAAFLRFWDANTHAEVADMLSAPRGAFSGRNP